MPKIPLVDVQAQYAPLTEELRSRFEGVLESAQFIRGPNVKAFEEEAAAYLGVRRAVGVANGTDALVLVLDAMGDRARRRGDLPGVHVLRDGRVDRPARRDAGFRGHRRRHAQPRPRGRLRPDHRPDEGDHARPPVRPPGAAGRARGARRPADRGRGAGVRRPRHRADRRRLDVQLLSDQEPLLPRRWRVGDRQRRRPRREDPDARVPRLTRQDHVRLRRLQLATRRAAGCLPARLPGAPRRAGRAAGARRPLATPSSGSATSSSCRRTSRATSTTSSCRARPSGTGSARR